MKAINLALKFLAPKAKVFENMTKVASRVQERILKEYLERSRNTEYGRKYGFSGIKTVKDYQRSVPPSDSESILSYIERMKKGESSILTRDKVISFGLTSGTTGNPKYIPITAYSRAKKAEAAELWAYYIAKDYPRIFDGEILAVISPEVEGFTEAGIPYGAESGHGYKNLPKLVRNFYALPYEVFDIKDYDARYYTILRIGLGEDITTIATLNPSLLVLLSERIERWKHRLILDIEEGILDGNIDMAPQTRRAIERGLRPDPRRASGLKALLKERGSLLPKDIWPNLQVIECWKGGTVKLYLKELPQYFGDVPIRDFGCLSTEARSSIPMKDKGAGGVLAINTNFYEFVPKEDMGSREKHFLLCEELEKGREYLIIVTTPGGLYRYDIDDIIKVNGFFNKTPVIEFVQKGMNAISITGEKIYESQMDEAVNKAVEKTGTLLELFSATVQMDNPARYIFLAEFEREEPLDKKKSLLKSIEEELYHQNAEYRDLRKGKLLGPPILKVVRKGDFERYRAARIAEGAHDTQIKVPELVPDANFQKNFTIEEEIYLD